MNLDQFRYYTAWHHYANQRSYDAPSSPWKLLSVDPLTMQWYHPNIRLDWSLGRVKGGKWDNTNNCSRLRDSITYRGLTERFEDGCAWKDTALFQYVVEQFGEREMVRGYESPTEYLDIRCAYLDDLFDSIREGGYRPNATASHEMATEDNAFEDAYANHLDPLVAISRTGKIYWAEGYHRFAIASILGLETIPVYVVCRHQGWQRVRDGLSSEPSSSQHPELEEYTNHPDTQDIDN